jgi:hypothetical protein
MCIDNNNNHNAVINYYYYYYYYYGSPLDFILPFKIPLGMRKELFEMYTKFRHAPSKCFDRPRIVDVM